MTMTLFTAALWLYSAMASLVFGATIYETLVVHPAWSRKVPESLAGFMGSPISRMKLPPFWGPVAPLLALSAIGAATTAYLAGVLTTPLMIAAACSVATVLWTLVYFRPGIERFLTLQGGDTPASQLVVDVRRWILLNWIRSVLVVAAWWGAMASIRLHA